MVKSEELLQFRYYYLLSDFEILSAITYTKRLLNKKDQESKIEFDDLSSFFFGGDDETAIKTLHKIDQVYQDEYFKRRQN